MMFQKHHKHLWKSILLSKSRSDTDRNVQPLPGRSAHTQAQSYTPKYKKES